MTDEHGKQVVRVPDEELDYDEELTYTHRSAPFTGIGYSDVPGHGLSEIEYRNGVQEGPSRDWYPSGRLKAETIYRNNTVRS